MIEVLNTSFEISIRIMLILEAAYDHPLTTDMLTAADFITVHGKEFGVFDTNLHGDNIFKFSEFAVRRDMIQSATKSLALDGLILIRHTESGFAYILSQGGIDYCKRLNSEYAVEYRAFVKKTLRYLENKNEQTVLKAINKLSIKSLHKAEE